MKNLAQGKAARLALAVTLAVMGTSYVMSASAQDWGSEQKPIAYEAYQELAKTGDGGKGTDIFTAKYSEKIADSVINGGKYDFSGGLYVKGNAKSTDDKGGSGSVTVWGLDARTKGLSNATISVGSVTAEAATGGSAVASGVLLGAGTDVQVSAGEDAVLYVTAEAGKGGSATAQALQLAGSANVDISVAEIIAVADAGDGGEGGDSTASEAGAEGAGIGGAGGNGGNAAATAVDIAGSSGTLTSGIIGAAAVAGAGGGGGSGKTAGSDGVAGASQATALKLADSTLTVVGNAAEEDAYGNVTGLRIAARASKEESAASGAAGGSACIAVGVQEDNSHIIYNVAGNLWVEATANDRFNGAGAVATGLLLSDGSTVINAEKVSLGTSATASGRAGSIAEGLKLTNHSLDINATADVLINAGGRAQNLPEDGETEGIQVIGLDAANSKINVNTAGNFNLFSSQYVASDSDNGGEASYTVGVVLDNSELNVKADGGIQFVAWHAVKGGDDNEGALYASDSVITLDAGKNSIKLGGDAEIVSDNKASVLRLLSDTEVNVVDAVIGGPRGGSLTVGGNISDKAVVSLMGNAESLKISKYADLVDSEIRFYDEADAGDSYLGITSNPANTSFRRIEVGKNLYFDGDNTLFIRSNSLAGDVGDRIIVDGGHVYAYASGVFHEPTVNINVFDEGMKTGYDGTKDGTGYNADKTEFDGKGFGKDDAGVITVIAVADADEAEATAAAASDTGDGNKAAANAKISDYIKVGAVKAAYDNGVWSYEYDLKAEKNDKGLQLTQVATTKAAAGSAPKAASDANKAAAAMAVSLFGADETLHERLGDIRTLHDANAKDENVWAKYVGGRLKTDGLGGGDAKVKYNGVEFGYDSSVGNNWIFGVAGEYVKGSSTLSSGSGKVKTGAGAVYGTWLGDKGHHLDIVGKIGRVDSESTTVGGTIPTKMKGDFDANAYSLSVEYGYKYDLDSNWFVAPMARLSYVHMGSASYDVKALHDTMHAQNDSFNSLVLRAGARVGTRVSAGGSLYFKLAALYDFDGDVATTLTADGRSKKYETDLGGFGLEYGLGYDQTIGKNSSFYFDAERISGGDLKKDWGVNAGLRFSF